MEVQTINQDGVAFRYYIQQNRWETDNFRSEEFQCPCCGKEDMSRVLIARLQIIRRAIMIPLKINSGWRCEKHNKAVGGAAQSAHLIGRAADISIPDGRMMFEVMRYVMREGSGLYGVGIKSKGRSRYIHVDNTSELVLRARPALWTY